MADMSAQEKSQEKIGQIENAISKIEGEVKFLLNRREALDNLHVSSHRAKEAKKLTLQAVDEKYNALQQAMYDCNVELEVERVRYLGGAEFVEPPIEDVIP